MSSPSTLHQPTTKRDTKYTVLPFLTDDLWMLILHSFVLDAYNNITVSALAQLARMRRVNHSWKQHAKNTASPFDAAIKWYENCPIQSLPVKFCGGVAFVECGWAPNHNPLRRTRLTIIRYAENGRMFAVSSQPHKGFLRHGSTDEGPNSEPVDAKDGLASGMSYVVVQRFYPIWRLAQLVGDHTADWEVAMFRLSCVSTRAIYPRVSLQH